MMFDRDYKNAKRAFGFMFVMTWLIRIVFIGAIIWGVFVAFPYVRDNGLKPAIERVWEGPESE